jgi:hypothetical protein
MVDTLRLALNASDVRELTGWPDAMVEDYIQILADLTQIINDLNQALIDIGELFNDAANLNSDLQGVRSIVAQTRAKINRIDQRVAEVVATEADMAQQLADAAIAKVRSRVFSSVQDYKAWLPAKGVLLTIEGQGASNPLTTNDYNVLSATRTAPGVYEVTVSQETYFTRNVLANSVFTHSSVIDPLTSSYNVEVVVTGATTFEIRVFEMVVVGASVQRGAYDLLAGDVVSVTALFSINDTLPPR